MAIYLGKNRVSYQIVTGTNNTPVTPDTPTNNVKRSVLNFYDYDGTLLHSYSRSIALALTELPSLPDRTSKGLVCQGWNWTLDDIKAYLTKYTNACIDVGPMYITNDGATWIDINIPDDARLNHPLMFKGNVTIDWGDGVTEVKNHTSYTIITHNYLAPGKYRIKLTVNSGTLSLGRNASNYNICGSITAGVLTGTFNIYSNRIENIFIGNNVTSIDSYVFYNCSSLQSITIPNSVISIGKQAFRNCYSLHSVTIPSAVKTISANAFERCYSLQLVTIPNSVTLIDTYAFYFCSSLQSITIPSSVTLIGTYAFYYCYSLQSITIPSAVTTISNCAFNNCHSLQSITIPNSVTSIGSSVFSDCYSLQSITIPNSVTSIGSSVFNACPSLQSITIPNLVTSIGSSAFQNCRGIAKYDFSNHTSVPTLANTNAFTNTADDKKIIVPDALYDEWIAATNWATYASYIVADVDPRTTKFTYTDGTSERILIEGELTGYRNRTDIAAIEIGTSVTSIGDNAFFSCTRLTSITIPSTVTSIGYQAFYNCAGLTSVTIPESVTTIDGYAFVFCNSLTSVSFEGKTKAQVGAMSYQSWGLNKGTTIICSDGNISINTQPNTGGAD